MTELEKRGEDPNEKPVAVPEDGGSVSFERIRLYLERHPEAFNLAGEIDFHDGYVGEDWPHRGYALARKDVEDLLEDVDDVTSELSEVKEALNGLMEQKRQWAKDTAEAERLRNLVHSMRVNGARHHFVFDYDKYVEGVGRRVQFCKDCGKEKEHPAHFAQGSRYLDSRVVEEASEMALERVERFLKGLNVIQARQIAKELLKGLPYIDGLEDS